MSIMPQPVIVHDSVHLFSCIQQCFQDILRKAVYSGDGATQGTVEGVLHILDSSLRLVWHQLGLVDVEGGGRWTFQQEICGEVLYWQRGNNPLDRTEIDTVFAQIKELIRRGGEAYDEHKLNLGGIAQTASLQQPYTGWQGDHDPIGHQSFFDEAFGFDPDTSPHGPSPSYGLHSLDRNPHKLSRMRP
ncbi:hypothetical protein JCM10295v2_002303 [Rhodotorula toruloides]